MAIHVLKITDDYKIQVIGISCHQKDYRLCFSLNKVLDFNFVKNNTNHEIITKSGVLTYSHYTFTDEDLEIEYSLLANRHPNGFLIPEHKNADYFLLYRNGMNKTQIQLVKKIKKIDFVLTAYSIDIKTLKSKEHLLV